MNIILAFILLAVLIGVGIVISLFIPKERKISSPNLNSLDDLLERKKDSNLKAPIFFFSLLVSILFMSWVFDSSYTKMVEKKLFTSEKENLDSILEVSINLPPPPKVTPPKPKLDIPKPPVKEPEIVEVEKKPEEKEEPLELPDLDDDLPDNDDGIPGEAPPGPPVDNREYFPSEVGEIPEFNGLLEYLTPKLTGIKAPAKYKLQGKKYRLLISFVVEKDGSLSDIKVGRRYREELGESKIEQIIETFKNMPDWKPGKRIDQPVRVRISQPIILLP